MENGWQMKCGLALPSSSAMLASPVTATHIQAQEMRNQMNMNTGHCTNPHDAREPRLLSPEQKSAPTISNMLNFGSCKSVHYEVENSFLPLLSAPPSFLQGDFSQQSNLKSSGGSYYPTNYAPSSAGKVPNWSIMPNNGNSNSTPAVDVHPYSQSRPTVINSKYRSHGLCDDLDALRALITGAGSRNENSGNASLQKAIYRAPSGSSCGQISHGSESNMRREAFLQISSSVANKQTPVVRECPRVFCMVACGDLLLSNTGLLGIHCSCHGLHMSVSNFCEHSGLSDVNPGNAVRMESGESIAQWRKLYLQKFGIRAPEDHRGWDWPEGLLTTPGLAQNSTAVSSRGKVFDLSSLFTAAAEPVKSAQHWNNVLISKPQPIYEYANELSKVERGNGCNQCSFLMSSTGVSRWNSHSTTDNPSKNCHLPSHLVTSRASGRGGLRNDCQSRSGHSYIISGSENSSSFAFQNLQSVGSKTDNNSEENIVVQRGTHSSRTDLKLGQSTQQGWGSGSTVPSAMRSNVRDMQKTTFQEQVTHNFGNSKVIKNCDQCLPWDLASDLHRNNKEFQLGPQSDACCSGNGASRMEHLKDGLVNSSVVSAPIIPCNTSAGDSSVHHMENNEDIRSYHFIPRTLHSQSHVDRSAVIDFSCNEGGGPVSSLDTNKLAFLKDKDFTMNAKCENNHSIVGSESSFRLYVKQMENSSFFCTNGNNRHFNSCTIPGQKFNSHQMPSMLTDISSASNYKDSVCSLGSNSGSDHINSSWGFGITQTLSTSSSSLTPVTVVLGPGLDPASLNKEVDYVNPHRSNESFRSLALRNAEKSLAEKAVDASFRLNQRLRTDANKGQHSKDCSVSNSWVQGSFLDPGPSKGIHKHPFNLVHKAKSTFCPGSGCKKAGNIRKGTKEEGTNNWENVEVGSCQMVSNSGVTDRCFQGSCGCQRAKQPSLSLCRSENKANDCNMLQGCSEGSCTYFSGMSHCTVQTMYPNRESDSKGICIINNLKSQARTEVVGAPDLNGSKLVNDSVPVIKVTLGDCNRKLKEQLDDQLECVGSRWRDVPSKMNPVAQLRCPNVPDKSLEADFQVEEFGGNAISITDQVADLKGKESSNVSSGCSEAVVTEASVEVNKTGSYTVDGDDTGNTNDQIADQGSTIDRSWSSADAIDSSRSSQSIFCSEGKPTEEESLAVLPNAAIHCLNQEFKLKHSESKELQSLGDFGASFDKVCNTTLNQNNQTNFRKRKRRTKWRTLGTSLASESPMHASKCDADDNAYMFEDVQVLFQSNQDSANMIGADLEAHIVKRRSGMYSVKTSRKRDLCGMYNVVEDELDDHRPVKGNDDSLANPENVVSKRLKPVKHTESLVRQPKRTEVAKQFWSYDPNGYETSKYSLNCCQKASCVSDENVRIQKAKPVACGKYGILCNQELDLDQIKPPKIVPLSQVLKSSRRLAKFNNVHALPSLRDVDQLNGGCKCIYEFFGSSSDEGSECNNFLSCTGGDYTTNVNDTIKTSHTEDEIVASDLSVLGEVEASENKRNLIVASGSVTTKSKPKEIRVRSLYELSMRGKEFILTNVNLSQNLMCTPSTVCESKRKEFGYTEKNDDDQCRVGTSRYEGQPPFNSIVTELDALCCVCGISNTDDTNCLLECGHCLIRIHQACYGISRVPKGDWYCRPCRTSSKDVACVLCGYGGGAMTRAFGSRNIVKSLLKAWNIRSKSHILGFASSEGLYGPRKMECENKGGSARFHVSSEKLGINNSIISGLNDRTVKQWVHMVCGLWTPGARCPNVSTMSAFDVSGVSHPKLLKVCYICKRRGGSCISCRVVACNTYFHPWCAHQKGLLQREVEDVDNHKMSFYGKCLLHANHQTCAPESNDTCKNDSETERGKEPTCARTEGYKGKNQECEKHSSYQHTGKGRSLVSQVQLDAWLHINRRKLNVKRLLIPPVSDADHDYRIEYARYKQAKGWKQLVVFKSGIHALGLYTSLFIPHGAMVVEYIGETVGLRVADKREMEYLSGRRAQYKGACYFFKIDKEHIIDATCKGGIARFVNHSCQPNCVAKVITVRSEKKVVFFAQRDIYPGEEITYDYHFNNEDEGKKIPCFCNSKNCRRFLN